jgi:hypothetical protein
VIVSEDAVVECGWRLTQLSPTPAPSLLSTSASEPFSDASCSCSEDGAESTVSFAMVASVSGGVVGTVGTGAGAGGRSGAAAGEDASAAAAADARFRVRALWVERRKYGMPMMMSSRAPGRCDIIELTTTAEGGRNYKYQHGIRSSNMTTLPPDPTA